MIGVFGSLEIFSILRYFYPFGSVKRNPSSRLRAVKRTLLLTKHPDWDLLERTLLDFSVVVCGVKVDQPRPLLLLLNPSAGGELIAKRHVYIYVNHLVTMVTRECGDCPWSIWQSKACCACVLLHVLWKSIKKCVIYFYFSKNTSAGGRNGFRSVFIYRKRAQPISLLPTAASGHYFQRQAVY